MKVNIINNGNGIRAIPFNKNEPYIEITAEQYLAIQNGSLRCQNGKLVDNIARLEAQHKIDELKHNLVETDYRAIKYAEGEYTEEEYAPYKKQRQEWRAEINELEEKLKGEK